MLDHVQMVLGDGRGRPLEFRESQGRGSTAAARTTGDGCCAELEGCPRDGRTDEEKTCKLLARAIGRDHGIALVAAPWMGREEGVDGVLMDPAGKTRFRVQVTRAQIDPEFWSKLARDRSARFGGSASDLAQVLRGAVDFKAPKARLDPDLVLALDATFLPALGLHPVVAEFRARHAAWAAQLGFREVWIVGPAPELTVRLDIPDEGSCRRYVD